MQKILMSELQKVNKVRQVIKAEIDGVNVDIIIKNPLDEDRELLYTAVTTILEDEDYLYGEEVITEENILKLFIEVLTNVEVDSFDETDFENNIALVELLSTINEIYSEIMVTIYANLTAIYNSNKVEDFKGKFLDVYNDYISREQNKNKVGD